MIPPDVLAYEIIIGYRHHCDRDWDSLAQRLALHFEAHLAHGARYVVAIVAAREDAPGVLDAPRVAAEAPEYGAAATMPDALVDYGTVATATEVLENGLAAVGDGDGAGVDLAAAQGNGGDFSPSTPPPDDLVPKQRLPKNP